MNKTVIEWTDFTWNPVSGCKHKCRYEYCYNTIKAQSPLNRFGAQYIDEFGKIKPDRNWKSRETGENHIAQKGEIYPYGYDPTFYPHRLNEPFKITTPSKVFVVDVGDLFGEWVPAEWIEQVLDVVRRCPHHTFQFLTKNPNRYLEYEFPDNSWVGTTVNSDQDALRAEILKKVPAPVRYLSIEPLLGEISFNLSGVQWIILGAQTGKNPVIPQKNWIDRIITETRRLNIPLFMKDNISAHSTTFVRKFPGRGIHLSNVTPPASKNSKKSAKKKANALAEIESQAAGVDAQTFSIILDLPQSMMRDIDTLRGEIGVDRDDLIKMWLHERIRREKNGI